MATRPAKPEPADDTPQIDVVPHGDGAALVIDDETFPLNAIIPGAILMDYIAAGRDERRLTTATYAFFDATVNDDPGPGDPDSGKPRPDTPLTRFHRRIRSPHRPIDVEQMFEIAELLVRHYGNRPTRSSRPTA